jgi:hypothetical protein
VDGVHVKDRRFLLLKRAVEPFKGCWHVVRVEIIKLKLVILFSSD